MKFSDLKAGMTVRFDHHDSANWYSFHGDFLRNPNFTTPEDWFNEHYRKYEGIPITVTRIKDVDYHGYRWKSLHGYSPSGSMAISQHWFLPNDENAFTELNKGVNEQVRMAPKPSAKRGKEILMGELLAVPGAKDYNEAAERFGTGRRTRRRRHGRHTRRR
jgi:hypothetical protein